MFPVSFILVRSELLTIHHLRMELLRGSWVDVRLGTEVLLLHSAVSVVLHVDVLHFFIFGFKDLLLLSAIQRSCTRREHRPCTTSACVSNRSTCRKLPTVKRGFSRTWRAPASWFSCTRWSPPSIFFSSFSFLQTRRFLPAHGCCNAMRRDVFCCLAWKRHVASSTHTRNRHGPQPRNGYGCGRGGDGQGEDGGEWKAWCKQHTTSEWMIRTTTHGQREVRQERVCA